MQWRKKGYDHYVRIEQRHIGLSHNPEATI
jgi:hypothetical protein